MKKYKFIDNEFRISEIAEICVDHSSWYSLKRINKELKYHQNKLINLQNAKETLANFMEVNGIEEREKND